MKRFSLLSALALLSTSVLPAQIPPIAAPAPPGFQFDGQTFTRAASSPTQTGSMEEYLPPGQTLSHWTSMTAIHRFTTAVPDPVAATQGVANQVKEKNPNAQILLMNNAASGDAIIDFVTWPTSDPNGPAYIEHDLCRYEKAPGGGLVVYQYAQRAYGGQTTPFLQNLKVERQRLLPLIAAARFDPR